MMRPAVFILLGLIVAGCAINGIASKDAIAKDRIGRAFSYVMKSFPYQHIIEEKSFESNGNHVIAVDVTDSRYPSPYQDAIVFHEIDKNGIIVNAWPDPESWKPLR